MATMSYGTPIGWSTKAGGGVEMAGSKAVSGSLDASSRSSPHGRQHPPARIQRVGGCSSALAAIMPSVCAVRTTNTH